MTSMRRPEDPAGHRAAGFGLGEDLRLELLPPRRLVEPRVREEAGLHARLREELRRVPAPLDRDLGEEEPPERTVRDDQAILAPADLFGVLLRLPRLDRDRRREEAPLDRDLRQLLGGERREPR